MYETNSEISSDTIPLSTPDMEFMIASKIREVLRKYLNQSILGYQVTYDAFPKAVVNWNNNRYQWQIKDDLSTRLITRIPTSKSFNLAGLKLASIINDDENLHKTLELESCIEILLARQPLKSVEIAYNETRPWLDEVIKVIHTNQELVHHFLKSFR